MFFKVFFYFLLIIKTFFAKEFKFSLEGNPFKRRIEKIENNFRDMFDFKKNIFDLRRISNKDKYEMFRKFIYTERSASFLLSYAASIKNNESFFKTLKQNTLDDSLSSFILNSLLITLLISDLNKKIAFSGKKIKGYGGY